MKRKILCIGMVGFVAALLAAVVAPTSAQAAIPPARGWTVWLTAPPAPAAARPASTAPAVAAASVPSPMTAPTTPGTVWFRPGQSMLCYQDNLCIAVWDPNYLYVDGQGGAQLGAWKVFYMYVCHDYALSNWYGNGYYWDLQRPPGRNGVKSYFKNQYGNVLKTITPDMDLHTYNWTPIWTIQNC